MLSAVSFGVCGGDVCALMCFCVCAGLFTAPFMGFFNFLAKIRDSLDLTKYLPERRCKGRYLVWISMLMIFNLRIINLFYELSMHILMYSEQFFHFWQRYRQ